MSWLCKDAKQALKSGGEWEELPDDVSGACMWYHQRDNGTWYHMWYIDGLAVWGGKLWLRYMSVDADGNWEHEDDGEMFTPDEDRVMAQYGYVAWLANYHAYIRWVAANGDDPMGEFMVKPTHTVKQSWRAYFIDSAYGCLCVGVKHGDKAWGGPASAPERVREYLGLSRRERTTQWVTSDFPNVADLKSLIAGSFGRLTEHKPRNGKGMVVGFNVDVEVPNRQYAKQLKVLANKMLKGVKK